MRRFLIDENISPEYRLKTSIFRLTICPVHAILQLL